MNHAISVEQLCKLITIIKERKTVPEDEIKKELNPAQFRFFIQIVRNLEGVKYSQKKRAFEVSGWTPEGVM